MGGKVKTKNSSSLSSRAQPLSPFSPFSLLTSCCFHVFSRGLQGGAPGDNRLPSDEGRSVGFRCGVAVVVSSPLPPAPRGRTCAAAAAFAGVLFAVAKVVDKVRVGLGRGLLFPLLTFFFLGGVKTWSRLSFRSKPKDKMNPYLSLSKFTLRLSSCSSLCLWNGVFLAWSLKFIVVSSSRKREKGKAECFCDRMWRSNALVLLPSFTRSLVLSLSRSPFPIASERQGREAGGEAGARRHAASGTREVASEKERKRG